MQKNKDLEISLLSLLVVQESTIKELKRIEECVESNERIDYLIKMVAEHERKIKLALTEIKKEGTDV